MELLRGNGRKTIPIKTEIIQKKEKKFMKRMNRFISLLMAAAVSVTALTGGVVFAGNDEEERVLTEAEVLYQKPYLKRAMDVLEALDVIAFYTDGTYKIDEAATRADLVVNILRVIDEGEAEKSTEVLFSDVDESHWAFNEINKAYRLGIINGYEDGLFRPDSPITLNEAVKVIINLLGYQNLAEAKGGYPRGYISVASDWDLLDSIGVANADLAISRGTMVTLLYNAIRLGVAEPSTFGANITVEYNSDETILSKHRNIYRGEGLVTANSVTALDDALRMSDSIEVTVGEESREFKTGKLDADAFLGYWVEFYYRYDKDTDTGELLFIDMGDEKYNNVLVLDSDSILPDSEGVSIKYYRDPENETGLKTAKVNERANVIYNGVYAGYKAHALDKKLLKPASGKVTLFDTDNDEKYDIVSITSYKTYFTSSVSVEEATIYDKYLSEPVRLDKYDSYRIFRDGERIELELIESDEILAVADAGKYIEITVVSSEPLIGSVAQIDGEDIYIAGRELEISKSYNIVEGAYHAFDPRNIVVGTEGTFYFDIDGKIVAFIPGAGAEKIAFVLNARHVMEEEEYVKVKLLESDGSIGSKRLAQKVKIDGVRKEEAGEILTLLKNSGMSGTGVDGQGTYQLIAYKENSKGEINFVDTTDVGDEIAEETLTLDIDDRKSDKSKATNYNATYYGTPKIFVPSLYSHLPNDAEGGSATAFSVDDSTPVFVLPVDSNGNMNLDTEDEKSFSAMGIGGIKTNENCLVSAYSLDKANSNRAKAVILKKVAGGSVDSKSSVAVVVKKIVTTNSDDEPVTQLTLLQAGVLSKLTCDKDAVVRIFKNGSRTAEQTNAVMTTDYIKKGHTIIYSQNLQGAITDIDVLYPAKNVNPASSAFGQIDPTESGWVWGLTNTDNKMYGKVLNRSGNIVKVKTENVYDGVYRPFEHAPIYTFFDLSSAKVSVIDMRNDSIAPGTVEDIVGEEQGDKGCFIILTYHNYAVDTAVVYKFNTEA